MGPVTAHPRKGSGLGFVSTRISPSEGNSLPLILRSSLSSVEKSCLLSLRAVSSSKPLASPKIYLCKLIKTEIKTEILEFA